MSKQVFFILIIISYLLKNYLCVWVCVAKRQTFLGIEEKPALVDEAPSFANLVVGRRLKSMAVISWE